MVSNWGYSCLTMHALTECHIRLTCWVLISVHPITAGLGSYQLLINLLSLPLFIQCLV